MKRRSSVGKNELVAMLKINFVAWRLSNFLDHLSASAQSGDKAAKPRERAARQRGTACLDYRFAANDKLPRFFFFLIHFDNPMAGFVNRIYTADQSIDPNKNFPANLAGNTESLLCYSDAVFVRFRRGASLSREESRELSTIIDDFLVITQKSTYSKPFHGL